MIRPEVFTAQCYFLSFCFYNALRSRRVTWFFCSCVFAARIRCLQYGGGGGGGLCLLLLCAFSVVFLSYTDLCIFLAFPFVHFVTGFRQQL